MRWALVLISVFSARAVQLGVEAGVESEMEALSKMQIEGVQDGNRVLVMVMKALEKFENKVTQEQEDDTKQCGCRQRFMENELIDLCGSVTVNGENVNKCPTSNDLTYGAGSLIAAAEVAVENAALSLKSALSNQAQQAENAKKYQSFMETTINQATQDEAQANKRLSELHSKLADMQVLAKALHRAIVTLNAHETGGVSSVPGKLTPGMTLSFVQLKEEVSDAKQTNNTYADKLEKQLLAFEVAAGVSAQERPHEGQKKGEALVQESNPARLYLMNDRADMLVGYLRSLYKETQADIKELQSGLARWQDAASSAQSPRDKANAQVLAKMGDSDSAMVSYRKEEIRYANEAAEQRRDLAAKQAQLDMMRTYMRETQMNQVIETEACRARSDERDAEKAALKEAKEYLQGWQQTEWNNPNPYPIFIQTNMATEEGESASEGAGAAFDTLKQLREDFETYRAQMQSALNQLNSDWKDCKRGIADADEELEKTKLELAQVQAMHNKQDDIKSQTDAAIAQLQKSIEGAEAKAEDAATKRDTQREANRKEAEQCESSVAVVHKVIEVLSQHFQNGATEGAIDGISGAKYSDATNAATRTDDGQTNEAAAGVQHNERTAEVSAIISSLQKVAFEFEKCGQTVRASDRKEENAFRRSQQDLMKLIQDLSVEKAYEQGQNSVANSRLAQLGGDLNTADSLYDTARDNTKNAYYKNCKEAVASYDSEKGKLKQKIENAIAVKDLIMVAMQNIKGVPAYPLDCGLELDSNSDPVATETCTTDTDPNPCVRTTTYVVSQGKTIDGADDQCQASTTGVLCADEWTCDTAMTGAECTCVTQLAVQQNCCSL